MRYLTSWCGRPTSKDQSKKLPRSRLCGHVPNIWPICASKTLVKFSDACQKLRFIGRGKFHLGSLGVLLLLVDNLLLVTAFGIEVTEWLTTVRVLWCWALKCIQTIKSYLASFISIIIFMGAATYDLIVHHI